LCFFDVEVPAKVAWIIQEAPCIAVALWFLWKLDLVDFCASQNGVLSFAFLGHYIQRTLIFPFLIRNGKPTRLIAFVLAFVFCSFNGYLQMKNLTSFRAPDATPAWQMWVGMSLFAVGMIINIHSDHILRNLRKGGEKGYKIPYGGLFDYVSGANFSGECLEWLGFAIANNSLPAWAFAFFTLSNIGPRAYHHHQWYLSHFGSKYPSERKILIPFVL
jgi:3-oxo-5-alpha-steroid 4-dehydrogenase 1